MSDHDRGAYTPQHDEPLSFDARQSRGRRAFPTTLLISVVILVGLGIAIFMFYRSGVRGAGDAPAPVGAPVGEIKTPASGQSSTPADTAQGLQIYKAEGGAPSAAQSGAPTTFAPSPEQPAPRPVPTAPVAAQPLAPAAPAPATAPAPRPAPPVAAIDPTASGAAKPSAPASKPVAVEAVPVKPVPKTEAVKPAPSSKTSARDEIGDLLDSRPVKQADKSAKADVAKAAPAPNPGAHGAALVQFGAFSSTELAGSEWAKLAKAYPAQMAGKGKAVEPVARDGKTLFRGAVSGFASRADAVAFCAKLKADGKACLVK